MKKFLDILAIVLPLALIVFGFLRVEGNRSSKPSARIRLLNGLTLIIAIVLLLIGMIRYFIFPGGSSTHDAGPRPQPITVSKHSDIFNNSIGAILNVYYQLTESFVNWDSVGVNNDATAVKTSLSNIRLDELKADTSGIYESALDPVGNAKIAADNIVGSASMDAKRTALNTLSENLRLLLIVVKYDREKLYWQECPMAFGEDKPGNWLSKTIEVRNPYLGNNHPEYRDKMLHCGEPKDTINFTPASIPRSR